MTISPLLGLGAKNLVTLIDPLAIVWLGLIGLSVWLIKKRKLKKEGGIAAGLALILWIFGATPVSGWLLASLERPYGGLKFEKIPKSDAVVLLGGGSVKSRYESHQMHLNHGGDRVTMAMDLMLSNRAPTLVIGGAYTSYEEDKWSDSEITKAWFEAGNKLPGKEIVALKICRNTFDEAVFVKNLAIERGWTNVLLVTSAFHMKRAAGVFRTQGIPVTVVPCNFFTRVSRYGKASVHIIPKWGGFEKTSRYVHEKIGWIYYRLRGWIKSSGIQDEDWWREKTP
jgi:uncharacterized SAM-binding protein YcdF (DUF218 family)